MTGKDREPSRGAADLARTERLKRALRENLKRRKAQQRGRARDGATHDSAGIAADKPNR